MAKKWVQRANKMLADREIAVELPPEAELTHCRAQTIEDTDWQRIVQLYDRLLQVVDSPVYALNRAIARSEAGDLETARIELDSLVDQPELRDYVWLDCARARLYELACDPAAAAEIYSSVLARKGLPPHQRAVIERRLAAVMY